MGATGVPIQDVVELMNSETTEVLLNFDADGIARIYKAGASANHEPILDVIYGDRTWEGRFKDAGATWGNLFKHTKLLLALRK